MSAKQQDVVMETTMETLSREEIARLDYVALCKATWRDPTGQVRPWDYASRTTPKSQANVEAVEIVATLRSRGCAPQLILVLQFRPAVGKLVLELPAGLLDAADEPLDHAALRELREETGYVGRVTRTSPPIATEPGLSDGLASLVFVEVDGERPENQDPVPSPDPGEFIQTILLPLRRGERLLTRLEDICEARSAVCDVKLYGFAASCEVFAAD